MISRVHDFARAFSFRHLKKSDVIDFAALCFFVYIFSDFTRRFFDLRVKYVNIFAIMSIFLLWITFKLSKECRDKTGIIIPVSAISFFVAYICLFYERVFGDIDVGAIIFHLRYGFEGVAIDEYVGRLLKYIFLFIAGVVTFSYLNGRRMWFRWLDRLVALPILLATPIASHAFGYLLHASDGDVLVAEYVSPQLAQKDMTPKNLILIYAESAERTFSDLPGGSEFFGDMNKVAAKGVDIRGIRQVENTGWTIAGMVASQCGVPLQPAGSVRRNEFSSRESFLPNVSCLGDILQEKGYSLSFVGGADLAFAGKGKFLGQHGYNEVFGLTELGHRAGDYLNDWGLYDDTLFEIAEEKLQVLASRDRPYVLSILTVGGHFPEGFPTKTCVERFGAVPTEQILFAMKCTGAHVRQFIESAERKQLLDNTVVVVMSDHLVMKNAMTQQLDQLDRMNFFTAIDGQSASEVRTKNSATFDIFPTLLELIGFEVSGRRAGLGVSLFSSEPSLIERYGVDALNNMIRYDFGLSGVLWAPSETPPHADAPVASVQ